MNKIALALAIAQLVSLRGKFTRCSWWWQVGKFAPRVKGLRILFLADDGMYVVTHGTK